MDISGGVGTACGHVRIVPDKFINSKIRGTGGKIYGIPKSNYEINGITEDGFPAGTAFESIPAERADFCMENEANKP